ncbi:MAG: hypothetical protein WCO00_12145 [Rhodospirillaceae bacterium]
MSKSLEVTAGEVYQRMANGLLMETAEVLALYRDSTGIPHVRYRVHHERTGSPDAQRTLAVAAFREMFTPRSAV